MTSSLTSPTDLDLFIAEYQPKGGAVDPAVWATVADFVREAVRASRPARSDVARRRLTAAAQLTQFGVENGVRLDREAIFHPDLVDRFLLSLRERNLSEATGRTYATDLRSMGRALTKSAPWRPTVRHRRTSTQPPYTPDDLDGFVRVAKSQRTRQRQHESLMLVALVAGAGLDRSEIRGLSADHIDTRDWVVGIDGNRPRRIAIERDMIVPVAEVLMREPGFSFADDRNAVNRMTARFSNDPYLPTLSVTRLRNTWLSRQITRVPFGQLLDASGYSTCRVLDDLYRMRRDGGHRED